MTAVVLRFDPLSYLHRILTIIYRFFPYRRIGAELELYCQARAMSTRIRRAEVIEKPKLRATPFVFFVLLVLPAALWGAQRDVTFVQSQETVDGYDFVEVAIEVASPDAANPFTDVSVTGEFAKGGGQKLAVEGFCDSPDGSIFRIRFMPASPGNYTYTVIYRQGDFTRTYSGKFRAVDGHRRGIVRVDPKYPWHFIWEGTDEHYFFNGTTAYLLVAWKDENVIRQAIDRLHRLKVNRMRVLLAGGRPSSYWSEPIIPDEQFRPYLNPWVAERPNSTDNPGFDYARFNAAYYQKFERMLRSAREQDMIISIVMDWNDSKVHPAALSDDEMLVKVGVALTCGTDLKVWRHGYHARMIVPPALFGHELAGVIEEVGHGVRGFKKGTRVVALNSAMPDLFLLFAPSGKPLRRLAVQ